MNFGFETETIEFKKTTRERFDACDDIVAILNKHGKGIVYFGIDPKGNVIGQDVSESSKNDIAAAIKDYIRPFIYPEIWSEKINDKNIIIVKFYGDEKPYSSNGIYYKRINERTEKISPEELKSMMLSLDSNSIWENTITKYGIDYINKDSLKKFYDKAVSCGRLEPLTKYDEKALLIGLGLYDNNFLTNAGYYLFSKTKPIVLKIATYVTDEKINFTDIKRFEGNIYELIEIGYNYIKEKINWHVEFDGNSTSRIEIPEVPVEAIREIVVNSFAHANYIGISEHEIDITPSKIEIYNPGEFPNNLTPYDFVTGNRKSLPRNKNILNVLYKSKDVEIFGSGFKKTYLLCEQNNIKIGFDNNEEGFTFIFYRKNYNKVELFPKIILNNSNLTVTELKVLEILKDNPRSSREDISKIISRTTRTVQRILESLCRKNYIIRVGSKKVGYWEVLK